MKVKIIHSKHSCIAVGTIAEAIWENGGYTCHFENVPSPIPGESKPIEHLYVYFSSAEVQVIDPPQLEKVMQAIRQIRSLGELREHLEKLETSKPSHYSIVCEFFIGTCKS